jgi:hypothetical protein
MAAPAQSTAGNNERIRAKASMPYKDFKEFFFELEAFKASLHGAPKGTYNRTFSLKGSELVLTLDITRQASYAKRPPDAPRVMPPGSLPLDENAKNLAQQALQKPMIKRTFEVAFPEDVRDKVQIELLAMVATTKLPAKKKARIVEMLRKPSTRPVARALDALWACMPMTQDRLCERDPKYTQKRMHFEHLGLMLASDPPRLNDVPAFAELYRRVYGGDPQQG